MRQTLTELLLDRDAVDMADRVVGKSQDDGVSKEAMADEDDDELGLGVDTDAFRFDQDPDELEKLATAVERVIGALTYVRPDLELEDILSLEGRKILEGREIVSLDGSPLEKVAASRRLTPEFRETLRNKFGGKS